MLVASVVIVVLLLDACAARFRLRPAYVDDGSDYSRELDEFHEQR